MTRNDERDIISRVFRHTHSELSPLSHINATPQCRSTAVLDRKKICLLVLSTSQALQSGTSQRELPSPVRDPRIPMST